MALIFHYDYNYDEVKTDCIYVSTAISSTALLFLMVGVRP